MRTVHVVLMIVVALVVAAPAPPTAAQGTPGVTADEIKIGALGALTGPGYLYGRLVMNGAEVVYNEVDKAGSVNGRKIALVREDDRCEAATDIADAKQLAYQSQGLMLPVGGRRNAG